MILGRKAIRETQDLLVLMDLLGAEGHRVKMVHLELRDCLDHLVFLDVLVLLAHLWWSLLVEGQMKKEVLIHLRFLRFVLKIQRVLVHQESRLSGDLLGKLVLLGVQDLLVQEDRRENVEKLVKQVLVETLDQQGVQALQAHLVKQDGMEAMVCPVLQEKLVSLGLLENRVHQVFQVDGALVE